jgi:DNA-binding MarR family transcriptional regulator
MLAGKQINDSEGLSLQSTVTKTEHKRAADDDTAARLRLVIARLSRRLRPTVAGSDLTPSEISVLFTIVRHGPLGLSELAESEAINPTMLSRITAQLASAGLIVRSPDPRDKRAALVQATAAGRRKRELVQRERTKALARHMGELPEEQRALLNEALPALEALAEQIVSVRP